MKTFSQATGPLVLVALSAFGTTAASGQSNIEPVSRADKPVYRVGDNWTYGPIPPEPDAPERVMRNSVIEVTPQQTRLSTLSGTGVASEMDFDSTGNLTADPEDRYQPARGLMDFPLVVGKSYGTNYTNTLRSGDILRISNQVTVEATEIVHVAAGDFFAFRLAETGTAQRLSAGKPATDYPFKTTLWYAPSVKRTIKWDEVEYPVGEPKVIHRWELRSYNLAPVAPVSASAPAP